MGDTDELLAWLRQKHQEMPDPEAGSFYSNAADEIVRLRDELAQMNAHADAWTDTANLYATNAEWWRARAERAEADADRLAEALTISDGRERAYAIREALLAHDKEVEAR